MDLILSEICVCIFLDIRGCVFETVFRCNSSASNELLSLELVLFRARALLASVIFLAQTTQRNCSVSRVDTQISNYGSGLVRNRIRANKLKVNAIKEISFSLSNFSKLNSEM